MVVEMAASEEPIHATRDSMTARLLSLTARRPDAHACRRCKRSNPQPNNNTATHDVRSTTPMIHCQNFIFTQRSDEKRSRDASLARCTRSLEGLRVPHWSRKRGVRHSPPRVPRPPRVLHSSHHANSITVENMTVAASTTSSIDLMFRAAGVTMATAHGAKSN